MATSKEFIEFVCEQIAEVGFVRYQKMFGEYMVYVNEKPILLVCDDTVFVKMLDAVKEILVDCEVGCPYDGARPHFILDIDNGELARQVVKTLEPITPLPKPRK
jgi:TfoX/Sxy family transcriptional regulator of competence genes